jgi:hypothetical protein
MDTKDLTIEEFTAAPGVITSLSQLTREQFLELMSSDHEAAKKFRKYSLKEHEYHTKSYKSLNDFYRDRFLKE